MKNFVRRLFSQSETGVDAVPRKNQQCHSQMETFADGASPQNSKELLSLVAESAPDMLLLYDLSSRTCAYVNRQVSVVLGFSKQEIENRGLALFESILHPEDRAAFTNDLVGLAKLVDGDVCEKEYRFCHLGGEWLWLQCRAIVFSRDRNGLPRQILCVARDMTEHRKYEQAVREEEARAVLNRFAVRIAHDINNPLANIKTLCFY